MDLRAARGLRPLAPIGLTVVTIAVVAAIGAPNRESYEWRQFVLLAACPVLVLALAAAARSAPAFRTVQAALGLIALLAVFAFVAILRRKVAFAGGVLQLIAWWVFVRRRDGRFSSAFALLAIVLLGLAAWNAAGALSVASRAGVIPLKSYAAARSADLLFALPLCVLLVVAGLTTRPDAAAGWFERGLVMTALGVIAVASLRVDPAFSFSALPHWGLYVAPAELVRQGGWLLWDVPSTYGFLTVLAIAAMPTRTAWSGLFVLNALAMFVSGAVVFFQFRRLGVGWWNVLFSAAVALSAVFWLPGLVSTDGWSATAATPSNGPMRFIWCLLLMVIARALATRRGARQGIDWLLIGGSVTWLIGVFCSFESAIYCSAVWLPVYLVLVWEPARGRALTARLADLGPVVLMLCAPLILLALATGAVWLWYVARLGHGPDWYSFIEYADRFISSGLGALPIDPFGAVWILVLVFCGLCMALQVSWRARERVALFGALGALWSTSSYFVWRSHELAITDALPIVCLAIGIAIEMVRRRPASLGRAYVETLSIPILAAILTLALGNGRWSDPNTYVVRGRYGFSTDGRSRQGPQLEAAFQAVGVGAGDPLIVYEWFLHRNGLFFNTDDTAARAWLPTVHFAGFEPLSEERRALYVRRFIARARSSGWFIQPVSSRSDPWLMWLRIQLKQTHRITRQYETNGWILTWYEIQPVTPAS